MRTPADSTLRLLHHTLTQDFIESTRLGSFAYIFRNTSRLNVSSTFLKDSNSLMFSVATEVLSNLDNVDSFHQMAQTAVVLFKVDATVISLKHRFLEQFLFKSTMGMLEFSPLSV